MVTKKYKLTEETINVNGSILHRIEAVRDFANIKKGDKGGYVEKKENLSQCDDCWVFGNVVVFGNAVVCGNAKVYGDAKVCGDAKVYGKARVLDNAKVYGKAVIYGNAKVCGNADVCGNAEIHGDAVITSKSDYIVFKNWWSSGRYFTWTKNNNMWKVGCFYGTGKELIEKAYKDSELSGREYERIVGYVETILQDTKQIFGGLIYDTRR